MDACQYLTKLSERILSRLFITAKKSMNAVAIIQGNNRPDNPGNMKFRSQLPDRIIAEAMATATACHTGLFIRVSKDIFIRLKRFYRDNGSFLEFVQDSLPVAKTG
jgi:hypothetical protein